MTPGNRIKRLRTGLGKTQAELAVAVGCSPQVLSNIERGYTQARPDLLQKIAAYFSVPVDYILGNVGGPEAQVVTLENEEERDLVEGYRAMSKQQKRIFMGIMEEILANRDE